MPEAGKIGLRYLTVSNQVRRAVDEHVARGGPALKSCPASSVGSNRVSCPLWMLCSTRSKQRQPMRG